MTLDIPATAISSLSDMLKLYVLAIAWATLLLLFDRSKRR